MKRITLLLLAALFVTIGSATAQDAATRLQEALSLERSVGDYEGAIAIYREIAGDAAADRRLVAQAVLHLGKAYESLGRTEAFAAYERVTREFGDQQDLASEARDRMRGLVVAEPESLEGIGPLGVNPLITEWGIRTSDDGQYVLGVDVGVNRLAYQRVGATELVYVSPDVGPRGETRAEDGYPSYARMSPDNSRIAYAWFHSPRGGVSESGPTYQLIVYDLASRERTVILQAGYVELYDWSGDGRYLLAWVDDDGLARIDASDGSTHGVFSIPGKDFDWSLANHCFMGNRYAFYDSIAAEGRQVRLVDFDAATNVALDGYGTNVHLLGCSDQRSQVILKSDLVGTAKASSYRFSDGRLVGPPVAIPGIPEEAGTASLSNDGDLVWTWNTAADTRIGVFAYSAETRQIGGPSEIHSAIETGMFPVPGWSRDGRALAFPWSRGRLQVHQDGKRRLFDRQQSPMHSWRWSADRSSFIISWPFRSTFRMDAETGVVTDTLNGLYGSPGRADSSVLAARKNEQGSVCIDEYPGDLSTRITLMCYPDDGLEDANRFLELSPDGRRILIAAHTNAGNSFLDSGIWRSRMALRLSVADLETEQVTVLLDGEYWRRPAWMPDGRSVLIQMQDGTFETVGLDRTRQMWFAELTAQRRVYTFRPHPIENKIWLWTSSRDEEREARSPYYVTNSTASNMGGQD